MNKFKVLDFGIVMMVIIPVLMKLWGYFMPLNQAGIIGEVVFIFFVLSLLILTFKNFKKLNYKKDLDSLFPEEEPPLDRSLTSKIAALCCVLCLAYLAVWTIAFK